MVILQLSASVSLACFSGDYYIFGHFQRWIFGNYCSKIFSQARCPSCHPTNSVKGLKEVMWISAMEWLDTLMLTSLLGRLKVVLHLDSSGIYAA